MRRFEGQSLVPPETKSRVTRAVLSGWSELLIEQHRGLFSYDASCIRIRTPEGILCVEGRQMVIVHFGAQDLMIRGTLTRLSISGEGA